MSNGLKPAQGALADRSFVVSSFGKTCHCTGWKVGCCVAPLAMTAEFRKVHQFVQFAVAAPMQAALAQFLVECPELVRELGAFYQRKRDRFLDLLTATPLRPVPTAGTYFQLADYSAASELPDVEFARALTREIGVAAIPISVFSAAPPRERVGTLLFREKRRDPRRRGRAAVAAGRLHQETRSAWNLLGQGMMGELAGEQLVQVVAVNHFWFSWAAFKPETRVYQP